LYRVPVLLLLLIIVNLLLIIIINNNTIVNQNRILQINNNNNNNNYPLVYYSTRMKILAVPDGNEGGKIALASSRVRDSEAAPVWLSFYCFKQMKI